MICKKIVAGSWWSELGLVMKALWQNYLMSGRSWASTLWLRFSIISFFFCRIWHWGACGDLRLKFSFNHSLFMSIKMPFWRYSLKWFMTPQHFTEVLSTVLLRSLPSEVWQEVMSTWQKNSAGNVLAPCQAPLHLFFPHSARGKHHFVMITHCSSREKSSENITYNN